MQPSETGALSSSAATAAKLTTPAYYKLDQSHLHPRVCFVHELKQLVDHCLQKLPVVAQEAGVLTHHIPALLGLVAVQ
jgi:hypothetical protein